LSADTSACRVDVELNDRVCAPVFTGGFDDIIVPFSVLDTANFLLKIHVQDEYLNTTTLYYGRPTSIPNTQYTDQDIRLYPNPVLNLLTIQSTNRMGRVVICNNQGEVVLEQSAGIAKDMQLDCSGLSSGIYFVTVCGKGTTCTKKFVKAD